MFSKRSGTETVMNHDHTVNNLLFENTKGSVTQNKAPNE